MFAYEFDFVYQNTNTSSVSNDLAGGATQTWSVFLSMIMVVGRGQWVSKVVSFCWLELRDYVTYETLALSYVTSL